MVQQVVPTRDNPRDSEQYSQTPKALPAPQSPEKDEKDAKVSEASNK